MTTLQELWDKHEQRPLPVKSVEGYRYLVHAKSTKLPNVFLCEDITGDAQTRFGDGKGYELDLPKPKLVPHFQAIISATRVTKSANVSCGMLSPHLYRTEAEAKEFEGQYFIRLDDRAILLPESNKP
jgi:hypothetical protein